MKTTARQEGSVLPCMHRDGQIWEFPKRRVPYFGVLTIRNLLFKVLY